MKFASRAKTIQNHFKMNIKNSPETMQRVIDHLRKELFETKSELKKMYKVVGPQDLRLKGGEDKSPILSKIIRKTFNLNESRLLLSFLKGA